MKLTDKELMAVFLSALVFPGAGQIYLKRSSTGAALILATCIAVVIPFYLFFQQLIPILIDSIYLQGQLAPAETLQKIWLAFTTAIHSSPWTFLACLIALILVWLYGIADLLVNGLHRPIPRK